jgi:hypothetical protein
MNRFIASPMVVFCDNLNVFVTPCDEEVILIITTPLAFVADNSWPV